MKSYNKDALEAIANPCEVASYLGIETRKSGAHTFIRCPMHEQTIGKADSKIGNCVLTKRGFKCFACGAFGDVFDLITAHEGCSYPEALKIVGDMYGGADGFLDQSGFANRKSRHSLSAEDLSLIGLSSVFIPEKSDDGKLLYNVSSKKEEETEKVGCVKRRGEYLLYQKGERMTLQKLQDEYPKAYYSLIERKAEEAVAKYQKAIKDCGYQRTTLYQDLLVLFEQKDRLPRDIVEKMKEAFEKKRKRAEEILKECRMLKEQKKN